jgi:hypothetical protein
MADYVRDAMLEPDDDAPSWRPTEPSSFRMVGDMAPLFGAKAKARGAFAPIVKKCNVDVTNKDGKKLYSFQYADLDAILDATSGAMSENGLDLSWFLSDAPEGGRALRCILAHSSGAFIESIVTIPPQDGPQELGSALTYARRYQAGCVLGVAPEKDDDGNAAAGQVAVPKEGPRRTPPAPQSKADKAVAEGTVLRETIDIASKRADQLAAKGQALISEVAARATAEMTPEQKATFAGPTVFNEPVPERILVNDEPLSEELAMKLRGELVRTGFGKTTAAAKIREVCGEGKERSNLTMQDGEMLLHNLKGLPSK